MQLDVVVGNSITAFHELAKIRLSSRRQGSGVISEYAAILQLRSGGTSVEAREKERRELSMIYTKRPEAVKVMQPTVYD